MHHKREIEKKEQEAERSSALHAAGESIATMMNSTTQLWEKYFTLWEDDA